MVLDSWAVTLFTFLQLEDERRLQSVVRESDRIDMAGLIAYAFHEPKKLGEIAQGFQRRLKKLPSRGEAFRRAAELLKKANPNPKE